MTTLEMINDLDRELSFILALFELIEVATEDEKNIDAIGIVSEYMSGHMLDVQQVGRDLRVALGLNENLPDKERAA